MKKIIYFLICYIILISNSAFSYEKKEYEKAFDKDDPAFITLFKQAPEHKNVRIDNYLLYASDSGKYNIAKAMIEELKVNVNMKDDIDWTPLHHAAFRGHVKIAKLLIQHGAKVNAKGGIEVFTGRKIKETPLHNAAEDGHFETVKLLVEHGADVNAKDYNNTTPLHYAASRGTPEMVEFLIIKGAKVNVKSKFFDGPTPLHEAVRRENIPISEILIKNDADLSIKNDKDETPYEYCLRTGGRKQIAEFLKQAEEEQSRQKQ